MTAEIKDWSQTKLRIQERWPGLPEEDIEASQGDRGALIALLEGRLGYARGNAEGDVDEILGGEVIVPEDVADERVHTGTSGPVGPVSEAPDFSGGPGHRTSNGDRAQMSQQPSGGQSSTYGTAQARQTSNPGGSPVPEGMYGAGAPPTSGDRGRWGGGDSWEAMNSNNGRGMWTGMPMMIVSIVGVTGTILVVGMMMGRRKRKQSKTEQVTEQARHLLEEITERLPSVEELRDKVRSLDELREKKVAGAKARR